MFALSLSGKVPATSFVTILKDAPTFCWYIRPRLLGLGPRLAAQVSLLTSLVVVPYVQPVVTCWDLMDVFLSIWLRASPP